MKTLLCGRLTTILFIIFLLSVYVPMWPMYSAAQYSADQDRTDADQAMRDATGRYDQLAQAAIDIISTKTFKRIPELYKMLSELENISGAWYKRSQEARAFGRPYNVKVALTVYGHINKVTAIMRRWIGDTHKEAGQFEKAREMYRSIIINYAGSEYRSEVKEAEFALEDLKEFEKNWKKEKASKSRKSQNQQ